MSGWIGVDLDGTLALYDHWRGPDHIGQPVPEMLKRVQTWIAEGKTIKIFTARADDPHSRVLIRRWLEQNGLPGHLEITNVKDYQMIELWDDRAKQVFPNTGHPVENFVPLEIRERYGR